MMTMERQLGVGVVGLHEGCTLLVALTHNIPNSMSTSSAHHTRPTRSPHIRVVGG